jgi:hypothetical protein
MRKLRVIPCACCLRPKLRESDTENRPGHYFRARLPGWCTCVEDAVGRTLKVGPLKNGVEP